MNDRAGQVRRRLADRQPEPRRRLGWGRLGTPSSMEETALAVEVLIGIAPAEVVERGLAWLVERVEQGGLYEPTPIGFYFAKLWYFEKLYPIIFTVAALAGHAAGSLARRKRKLPARPLRHAVWRRSRPSPMPRRCSAPGNAASSTSSMRSAKTNSISRRAASGTSRTSFSCRAAGSRA